MSSIAVNSGIIPRLVGEVLSLLLYRGACFLVSKINMLLTVRQVLSYQKLIYMIYLYFFTRCIFVCNPVLKNDKINSQSSHVFHAFIVFHINFSHACQICHLEGRLKAFEKQKKDIIPST